MKILLADDHTLFREGLKYVLKELDTHVDVLEAGDSLTAINLARDYADLDLALLDLNMPGMDGFQALVSFREQCPSLPVVMLSASESRHDAQKALDLGASGFISKSASGQIMLSALRLVLSGGVYLPLMMLEQNHGAGNAFSSSDSPANLTERQLDVLLLLAQGKPNKIIARELGITEGTVKIHMAAIFRALHASNRTEAVIASQKYSFSALTPF
ncbi:response regulator [Sulfurirhabdus autotrophica]|uniref:LuxR family two component transcriptional regulator n=1 Tax=Sulfurirhabdus autotrophica TaxID=1706046 RepID=A0A4V6P3U1_9PROT|nr:response regulator transcription factor [Sulfurirhabdus autotrophica]TCV83779.1 LuxR family two component transcriptional regulator [Sulfurirhabdus autotrophica]